jgi:P4 family phage/plasmid primase-like protien
MSSINQNQISKEQLDLFRSIFNGRKSAYGADEGKSVKATLTDDIVRRHLTGQRRIGIYPLSPNILNGGGTHWIAADIDDDKLDIAIKLRELLEQIGVSSYIETSKSKGYHVWIFFSEAVSAQLARATMKHAITILEKGTGYRVGEIFPKQDSIGSYGYGNYINLPLHGEDVKKGRTVFLDPDNDYKPYSDQMGFLQSIQRISSLQLDDTIADMGIELDTESVVSETDSIDQFNNWHDMYPCFSKMMNGVGERQRNTVCFTLAKHMRAKSLPPNVTLMVLKDIWNPKNEPPIEDGEIQRAVEDVYFGRKGQGYKSLGCSDDIIQQFCGKDKCSIYRKYIKQQDKPNSKYFDGSNFLPKLLADELMEEYTFINVAERIYVYEGGVFKPTGEAFIKPKCREKLEEFARISHVKEVVEHIADSTLVRTEELNTHKDLINLANGMLDWRTMQLLPHSESYLSTARIPIEYSPDAVCPNIDQFLMTTLTVDCIPLLEELLGYILIPDVRHSVVFILTGSGANGKSTFLNLLEAFIGTENVSKVPLQELDSHKFKRADIFGKLVNLFADLDPKDLESSTYLKTISTGDQMDAERKNKDPFYFRPYARLIFSCNSIPKSPDKSFAFYRRLMIISFPNQFTGKKADKSLIERLTRPDELSGLLNRALVGLKRLFENDGFSEAESVGKMLEEYKKRNDNIAAFITDCCDLTDLNADTERQMLYNNYSSYCNNSGYPRTGKNEFYERIRTTSPISEVEKTDGKWYFRGIKIKTKQPIPAK